MTMNVTLDWLTEQCVNNLLAEKWLLCADLRAGQTWKDRVNLAGTATVNLHGKTIRTVVLGIMRQPLAAEKLTYLNSDGTTALVHGLVVDAQNAGVLRYFSEVRFTESLAKLLSRSFRDMRLACISAESLAASAFHSLDKAADVRRLYEAYGEALVTRKLIDYAGCLARACEGLGRGSLAVPQELVLLMPADLQLTFAETQFLNQLARHVTIKQPNRPPASPDVTRLRLAELAQLKDSVKYLAGYGEANEVRAVMQRILQGIDNHAHPFDDVELLVTDPKTYAPLLYESLLAWMARRGSAPDAESNPLEAPPVTFADGLPCIYSRPGRALRAWLRWIRTDGVQAKAVQMLREGIFKRPESATEIGYARLASQLRKLSIGFRVERYLPMLQSTIKAAEQQQKDFLDRREDDDRYDNEFPRDYGLPALQVLHQLFGDLIRYAPSEGDTAAGVLAKAKQFLLQCARSEDRLDRYARGKLLDAIDARAAALEFAEESPQAILAWLEELPLESSILASGPQPGCLHVASLFGGGISGRRQVFVMGLDANRFPRSAAIDPVLLDDERTQLSDELRTSSQAAKIGEQVLLEKLGQVLEVDAVRLRFSFSTRNLIDGRSQSPSPSLVEIFRLTESKPQAHIEDLLRHIGPPVSFASRNDAQWLDPADGFTASLLSEPDESLCRERVEASHGHFAEQRVALEQRATAGFTHYDGWVPEAGNELTPTNPERRVSPSRLETFGACPRRFFFKYGLGVFPPDEWNMDLDTWLDPLRFGKLVHQLFEVFLRKLSAQSRVPNFERDLQPLLELLGQKLEETQLENPIPSEDAFQRQCALLEEMCEIFLRKEEEYCTQMGAVPWVLEPSIGLGDEPQSPIECKEPVSLTLRDGRLLRIGGRIDRVDQLAVSGSEHYVIWDYKSGSSYGFSQADPFQQGRKLQSYLYVGMLRHRLAATGHGSDVATSFGYFFPNPKTEGQRLQWTAAELKAGDDILQLICDLIANGMFPATTNAEDCTYCDFRPVCDEPQFVAAESLYKTLEPENRNKLKAWRELREL
jgi:RecB family exonuclease